MNLFDMACRKDRNLVLSESARATKLTVDGQVWRGIDIAPAREPQIRILHATRWYPLVEHPESCGWFGASLPMGVLRQRRRATLALWFEDSAQPGSAVEPPRHFELGDSLHSLALPWSFSNSAVSQDCNLVMHVPPSSEGRVFLAVHRALNRQDLIQLAQGNGVEIGPGPHPQIKPGSNVTVTYVEQMAPDQWQTLYNAGDKYRVNRSLWEHYRLGEAHALPVENGTLDFIFSSHVFEHLANPLGHLDHWRSKLKSKGLILGIVPDIAGTKDYDRLPCSLVDFIAERDAGTFEPTLAHYRRYAEKRAPGVDPADLLAKRRSIHVHYFTHRNMAELLRYAVAHHGFSGFHLMHSPNHKDFYFVLINS